jgi:hypothetical protein
MWQQIDENVRENGTMHERQKKKEKKNVVIIGYACGIFSLHVNNKGSLHVNKDGFLIKFKSY